MVTRNEATVLEDEKAELAIMNDKMAKMVELQTALDNAVPRRTRRVGIRAWTSKSPT